MEAELAYCQAAPRAIKDLDFARSQPAPVSARLLLLHARMLDQHKDQQNAIKAVSDALYGLTSTAGTDMFEVARYLAAFIRDLDSGRWPRLERTGTQARTLSLFQPWLRTLATSSGIGLGRQYAVR